MKSYKLVFAYPDGHIEEDFDQFMELEKAKEYGEDLLGQVLNTESVFKGEDNDFGFSKKHKPYFMVYEVEGEESHLVYESKR